MIRIFGKNVPTELAEIVQPRSSALMIIDMQNDYCSVGGGAHAAGADLSMYQEIIPPIARFSALCRSIAVPVINVKLCALPEGRSDSPAWIRLRMRANWNYALQGEPVWNFTVAGTWGADFVPALKPDDTDFIVTKFRSSAFHNTDLELILRANGVRTVLVAGCTTEGCVESAVRDLTAYDYFPVLLEDCVGSDKRELHEASMVVMGAYRADVATSTEVIQIWSSMGLDPKE